MITDKPSIAELQRMCARDTFTDEGAIIEAAPVLLEIAAAALAARNAVCTCTVADRRCRPECPEVAAGEALDAALAKVTP